MIKAVIITREGETLVMHEDNFSALFRRLKKIDFVSLIAHDQDACSARRKVGQHEHD